VAVGPTAYAEPAFFQRSDTQCLPDSARRSPTGVHPGPAIRRSPSEQAPCARLVVPGKCRPGAAPPARQHVVSQRSSTLCPPGSDRRPDLADHCQPARIKLPAVRHACPPGSDQRIRAGGSPPAGERTGSRRSSTHARPRVTGRSAPAGHRRPASERATPAVGHAVPAWLKPGEVMGATGPAAPGQPGAGGGGEARSRRRSRSAWSGASRGSVCPSPLPSPPG
jgi:hypothetical protein